MFNAVRQLGGAIGVAVLTTAIVLVGPTRLVAGVPVADLDAYRAAFLVASATCLVGVGAAASIRDEDAAGTIPPRRRRRGAPTPTPEATSADPVS
jgi:hypothetical protein